MDPNASSRAIPIRRNGPEKRMAQSMPVYGHNAIMPPTPHFRARASFNEPPPMALPPSPQTTFTHLPIGNNGRASSRVPSQFVTSRSLSMSYTPPVQLRTQLASRPTGPVIGRSARTNAQHEDTCIANSPTIMSVLSENKVDNGPGLPRYPSGGSALFHSLNSGNAPSTQHPHPSPSPPSSEFPEFSPGMNLLNVGSPDDLQFAVSLDDSALAEQMSDLSMMY